MRIRAGVALAAAVLACATGALAQGAAKKEWVQAWYSPPFPPTAVLAAGDVRIFSHQTVRQVVRMEAGGDRVRVRLSNELGLNPVKIGSVHIALSSMNAVTEPASDHVLTFNGRREVELAVGSASVSDPVDMRVGAFANLAISIYYPGRIAPAGHLLQVHLSEPGEHGADAVWSSGSSGRAPAVASGVEVETVDPRPVIVAAGDSITEGAGATPETHSDWPEQLARQLGTNRWVVINSGISGNRVLHEGAGPAMLARFERDVLSISGVKAIVLTEGINDIGWAYDPRGDSGPVSAADIVNGYEQLIARAHARGIKIYGGTLNPYEGATYYHEEGEKVRQAVNAWIRGSGAFDGVVDFERAVRDPSHPTRYLGSDQSGDNLHPNDAGYTAMAAAVAKLFQ